jgi:glutamate--cysteine ligase
MSIHSAEDGAPVRNIEDLTSVFRAAEKPSTEFLLGTEAEKFGVHSETFEPLGYEGAFGVERVLKSLIGLGWAPERETEAGPLIALVRGRASVTLEPGAQLELSGSPLADVHLIRTEVEQHLAEIAPISSEMKITWLSVGFHPLAAQRQLPWVPKQRYAVMREYLPKLGSGAHDMMRRTATVQVNIDFSDEEDALRKLRVGLLLSPLFNVITANSPFRECQRGPKKSLRGDVWLRMDPARSGLIPRIFERRRPTYVDYAEWALDAGMFLIKRHGRVLHNTGQTFRDFMGHGFQDERATLGDWKLHLNTVFPEVRLKNTLEIRAVDALPLSLLGALPALVAGIFYDDRALQKAEDLAASLGFEAVSSARPELVTRGLDATIGGISARALGERLLEIALGGLDRRARLNASGESERIHLEPLVALVSAGLSPADRLLAGLEGDAPFAPETLVGRTRIET